MSEDKDLKKLSELLYQAPSQTDVQRWKKALRNQKMPRQSRPSFGWAQLVAAVFVGFLLGAATMYRQDSGGIKLAAKNFDEPATFEHVYINDN